MQGTIYQRITPGMLVRMFADAVMIQLALIVALTLRIYWALAFTDGADLADWSQAALSAYLQTSWPLTLLSLIVFYINGFYTYGRFYTGRFKALVVTQAVCQSYLLFGFLSFFFAGNLSFPRAALITAWLLTIVMLAGARLWQQIWHHFVHPEREFLQRRREIGGERVLVIGGAGYIGSALLPKLLEQGYHVRLLDVLLFGESPIEDCIDHPNLEVIQGDFRHVENVVEAMRDVDAVVHLGAIVGDPACSLDEDLTIDVNLSASRMIAELAKAAGVRRFVFASTCSVYGACDETLDEHSQTKPVSLYGHTKLASERVLLAMATDSFQPTIVRFATIYGLSGRTRFDLVVNVLSAKAKIENIITVFGGDQWRPFVHVDDAAQGVALILQSPIEIVGRQIFNVGSNEQNYTITQIGELVHEQVMSADLQINTDDTDKRNYRVDFSKIRNQLGFKPNWTVEEGITQVLEAIASGDVVDYQDSQYSNVKFLTESGTKNFNRDAWAKEMIHDLTGG